MCVPSLDPHGFSGSFVYFHALCFSIPYLILVKKEDGFPELSFENRQSWRDWLADNGERCDGIWLVFYKKAAGKPTVSYQEAVLESLCFGWIDSKAQTVDAERYRQIFTPRKSNSEWSKVNKAYLKQLMADGLMAEPGLRSVAIAKENGSWTKIDAIEDLLLPPELEAAFEAEPALRERYEGFSVSARKYILRQVYLAKRPETKARRLENLLEQIRRGESPV